MNDFATPITDEWGTSFQIQKWAFTLPAQEWEEWAVKREWKDSEGNTWIKWEHRFKDMTGIITGVEFKDGKYGESFVLELTNSWTGSVAKIYMPTNGRYFESFAKVFKNIDLSEPVVLNAYDFEDEKGKKVTGISTKQDGVKIQGAYYNPIKKESIWGFPKVDEAKRDKIGKEYWKSFYLDVKFFLKDEILAVEFPDISSETPETEKVTPEPALEVKSKEVATPETADAAFNDSADVMQ